MKNKILKGSFIFLFVLTSIFVSPQKVSATPDCSVFQPPMEDYPSYYLVGLKDSKVLDSILFEYTYPNRGDSNVCTRSVLLTELTIAKKNEVNNYLTKVCLETSDGIYLLRTKTYLGDKRLLSYNETCSKNNIKVEKVSNIPEFYGFYKSFDYLKYSIRIIEEIFDTLEYFIVIFPYNLMLFIDLILTAFLFTILRTRRLFKVVLFLPVSIIIYLVLFFIYYNILRLH